MMTNTVTITFRAKRDEFSGGIGYKVPALTPNHYTFAERDTVATLLASSRDLGPALARFGVKVPGVVWEPDAFGAQFEPDNSAWKVTPRGNGFMADVTATFPLVRTPRP
jgi:hypothetical protein